MTLIVLTKIVERKELGEEKESLLNIITTKDFLSKLSAMYVSNAYLSKYIVWLLVNICKSPVYYKLTISNLVPEVALSYNFS